MSRDGYLLLVEDDFEMRETLSELLQDEGFRVVGCAHGKAALDQLHADAGAALILLDVMMPVMNGGQFRTAQLADKRLAHIPVILFSATPNARGTVSAHAFLLKPVKFDEVLETIEAVLAEASAKGGSAAARSR